MAGQVPVFFSNASREEKPPDIPPEDISEIMTSMMSPGISRVIRKNDEGDQKHRWDEQEDPPEDVNVHKLSCRVFLPPSHQGYPLG